MCVCVCVSVCEGEGEGERCEVGRKVSERGRGGKGETERGGVLRRCLYIQLYVNTYLNIFLQPLLSLQKGCRV